MWVRSLGQEDLPLDKEDTATHSSILAWRILWTEEPGGLQSVGRKELSTTEATEHARTRGSQWARQLGPVSLPCCGREQNGQGWR